MNMLKSALALTGGRFFNLAVSMILLLIQARFIGPEITGLCQSFSIPVGYMWILTLGVSSALARELPYYLARGEREKAMSLTQTAQSFSIVMGSLCASVFLFLSIRALILGEYLSAAGWGFQIVAGFTVIYSSYIKTLYRTTTEFVTIAKASTITAVTSIVTFPLIFVNAYLGIWTRGMATSLMSNAFLFIKRPFKLAFGFDFEQLKQLIRFGLPLIAIGYIESSLWTSTQLSLIFKMCGNTSLGLFTFTFSILNALLIIPNAVAEILRPRFAAAYGETDGHIGKTLAVAFKPLTAAFIVSVLMAVLAYIIVDDIIILLLPKYIDAIPALGIAFLLIPVMALTCIKYIFVVTKNMRQNLMATAPGFLVGTALLYTLLSRGAGFEYVFLPYVIGQLLNFFISLIILMFEAKKERYETLD